ncbi:MAG TPA: uracil-DNA glycosylase [Gemmatales bacterium]|nr:uracil-DNA glycosylase [Gemmatales bacterium]
MTAADLARMASQHAASLQAGGIDWLPTTEKIEIAAGDVIEPEQTASTKAVTPATPRATTTAPADTAKPTTANMSGEVLSSGQKRIQLQLMNQKEVEGCTKCTDLVRNRTRTVFGVGNIDTELVFVGEAPGADEDKAGEPFVGAAGQLLNKIIAACKLERKDIYICNVLKCRPPGNRQPLADEVINCRGYLERQLSIIRPRFICCLGLVAAQTVLNSTTPIGKLRKQIHDYQGIRVVATYHPAYLLRNPNAKKDVWEDMKMMMEAMGRPV